MDNQDIQSKVASYTAAGVYPEKLFRNKVINDDGSIIPIHVQLNPTNKCNLDCSFCSCANRNQDTELHIAMAIAMMDNFAKLGCKAVTITGGGEPLLYPAINSLIKELADNLGLKVGLVTNGTCFYGLGYGDLLTWCRVSISDYRIFKPYEIQSAVNTFQSVDWAFSYVVTSNPSFKQIRQVIETANELDFTHVRLVSDLLDVDNVISMGKIKEKIQSVVDDSKVIYQGRKVSKKGAHKCLISLLKPVIGADGSIYPCCGTQYAEKTPSLDYGKSMEMGDFTQVGTIWANQDYFIGDKCERCYYTDYNKALSGMFGKEIEHREFV